MVQKGSKASIVKKDEANPPRKDWQPIQPLDNATHQEHVGPQAARIKNSVRIKGKTEKQEMAHLQEKLR
ncbi:hypothetical protein [Oceanirhabdus sp. W0125-5]|uniref:hypothetical protein n=1 Tax=Oceanirhabdus sp. W0125-5 TaxID=2999116 RepID=UPI0022F31243|nr:hypothetical protein [Oceanirhabdus sp. W0125-5]WBW98167.1 hypothetical protein OW730_05215 [Oceanirhabdus sp. W0125-5]